MSMLCTVYRISVEQAAKLRESPDTVDDLLGYKLPTPKAGILTKIFGERTRSTESPERSVDPITSADTFELDQAWHILHFLFSGGPAEGDWPAAFLVCGGEHIGPDHGYGPVRLLAPDLAGEVARFLGTRSLQSLEDAYVPDRIDAAGIYWQASTQPELREQQVYELWSVVEGLRTFFEQTSGRGGAVLISIF